MKPDAILTLKPLAPLNTATSPLAPGGRATDAPSFAALLGDAARSGAASAEPESAQPVAGHPSTSPVAPMPIDLGDLLAPPIVEAPAAENDAPPAPTVLPDRSTARAASRQPRAAPGKPLPPGLAALSKRAVAASETGKDCAAEADTPAAPRSLVGLSAPDASPVGLPVDLASDAPIVAPTRHDSGAAAAVTVVGPVFDGTPAAPVIDASADAAQPMTGVSAASASTMRVDAAGRSTTLAQASEPTPTPAIIEPSASIRPATARLSPISAAMPEAEAAVARPASAEPAKIGSIAVFASLPGPAAAPPAAAFASRMIDAPVIASNPTPINRTLMPVAEPTMDSASPITPQASTAPLDATAPMEAGRVPHTSSAPGTSTVARDPHPATPVAPAGPPPTGGIAASFAGAQPIASDRAPVTIEDARAARDPAAIAERPAPVRSPRAAPFVVAPTLDMSSGVVFGALPAQERAATDRLLRARPNTAFAAEIAAPTIDLRTTTAPVPAAAPAPIDTSRQEWLAAMIDRIEVLASTDTGSRETRITLSPDALGEVSVRLIETDAGVQVALDAAKPEARALLAEAAPRLAEMAETRGLRLASHGGGETPDQRHRAPPQPQSDAPLPNRRSHTSADRASANERIA